MEIQDFERGCHYRLDKGVALEDTEDTPEVMLVICLEAAFGKEQSQALGKADWN